MAPKTVKRKEMGIKEILLLLLAAYVVVSLLMGSYQIYELKKQQHQIDAMIDEAEKEQSDLEEQYEYMQSSEAMEKVAREKLGLIKKGELLIQKAEKQE